VLRFKQGFQQVQSKGEWSMKTKFIDAALHVILAGSLSAGMVTSAFAGSVRKPLPATPPSTVPPPPPVVVTIPQTPATPPVVVDPTASCNQAGNTSVSRC
jgi:hypothetical protein